MLAQLMKLLSERIFIPLHCNSFSEKFILHFNTIVLIHTLGIYLSFN
jgi:hypothetical protein